jgi:hypothetical protein
MTTPKDEEAKKQLDSLVNDLIKPAMERYKKAHAQLAAAPNKLEAAIARHDVDLIDFESRALRKATAEVGSIVDDIKYAIMMLDDFAENPDQAGSKDAAARWVSGLGAARKDLEHGVQKADHALAKAERALHDSLNKGGKLEAAWAAVRAQAASNLKMTQALSTRMDQYSADALAAAKKLDGSALELQRKGASGSDAMAQQWISSTQELLADFDRQLAVLKPGADFKAIYPGDRKQVDAQLEDIKSTARDIRKQYTEISVLQVQYNFVKIAQSLGVPLDEAKKLAPALAQNDSAKLKALESLARKHKLDGGPKELLAGLRKNGLVGRA